MQRLAHQLPMLSVSLTLRNKSLEDKERKVNTQVMHIVTYTAIVRIVILDHSPTVACDTGSVKIIQSATISLSQEGRMKGMMYMNHMQL